MKEDVVRKLIQLFPDLREAIKNNIEDFPEIYLHLIFGDVFNPYLCVLLEEPQKNQEGIKKSGELLEYMANLDVDIQEVVAFTVLERLSDSEEKFGLFYKYAGEKTRQFMNEIK